MSLIRKNSRTRSLRKRATRQQKQERSSPLAIFPTSSPPTSEDEAHSRKDSATSESYSAFHHPITGVGQNGNRCGQKQLRKSFSSRVIPPASPPISDDEAHTKQAIKLYPTVFLPSAGVLTVDMFASPNETESEWPDLSSLRQINVLHPAFTLALYIADDELTFNFTLGPFTRLFYHRTKTCFERGAKEMVAQALVRGFDGLLRAVMRLPVFAHMVFERAYRGFETGVDWRPSEEELERHWMVCWGHGWICQRVD